MKQNFSSKDENHSLSKSTSCSSSVIEQKVKSIPQRRGNAPIQSKQQPRRRHSYTGVICKSRSQFEQSVLSEPKRRLATEWQNNETKTIHLTRKSRHEKLGFTIRGGGEHNLGIYVSQVDIGSPAHASGMVYGDEILSVNNNTFQAHMTHEQAVKTFAEAPKKLILRVRSTGQVPNVVVTSQNFAWTDVEGRPTSPPADTPNGGSYQRAFVRPDSTLTHSDEKRVGYVVKLASAFRDENNLTSNRRSQSA